MKPSTPLEYIEKGLLLTRNRRNRTPKLLVYSVIIDQLECINFLFNGAELNKSRLHKLTVCAIAAKEVETTDAELADVLMDVYFIADQSANGMKIVLPD